MTTYKVAVIAINDELDPDDEDLPGLYEFEVESKVGDNVFDAIMDEFHAENGIEEVDDFVILLLDENDDIVDPPEDDEADVDIQVDYLGKVSDEVPMNVKLSLDVSRKMR